MKVTKEEAAKNVRNDEVHGEDPNVWLEYGLQYFPSLKSCLEQTITIAAMETVNLMEEDNQKSDLLHFQKNQLMKFEPEDGPNLCVETILLSTALQKIARCASFIFQKMWT